MNDATLNKNQHETLGLFRTIQQIIRWQTNIMD